MSGAPQHSGNRMRSLYKHTRLQRRTGRARTRARRRRAGVAVGVAVGISALFASTAFAASAATHHFRSHNRAPSHAALLVGNWLGPGDGATNCGAQVDELWLYKNLSFYWTVKSDSPDCADVTFWGQYRVQSATQILMYPTGSPCGAYCTPPVFRLTYRFVSRNAVNFCGYAGPSCFTHHRQT